MNTNKNTVRKTKINFKIDYYLLETQNETLQLSNIPHEELEYLPNF